MNPSRFTVLLVFAALTAPPAFAASTAAPLFADEVVAKGKAFEIRQSQLDDASTSFRANAAARGQPLLVTREELDQKLLDKLINIEMLKAHSTGEDRAKATNRADKVIADMQAQAVSLTVFVRQLQAVGTTPAKFRVQVIDQLIGEEVVERELKGRITITTEQARKFYDENSKQFLSPEAVHVAHILLSTRDLETRSDVPAERRLEKRATADKVLLRARAGEDFGKLVKEFSEDVASKEKGGEYTFARGQMVPEFDAASFSLAPNQISDIVTTIYGYHIIKLLERLPPKPVEFATVEPRIKDALAGVEMEKQMPAYLERIKQEAGVQILLPAAK